MRHPRALVAVATCLVGNATTIHSQAPATPLNADTAVTYEVSGLKVIHQPRAATSNVIAVELYLLGGSRQITAENAGIEPFLLMASEYGTRSYPGEASRRALARTGGSIVVETTSDWTSYGFYGIKQEFDSSWAVFADRLMHPTLDSTAIRIVRTRMLAAATRRVASPEDYASFMAESLAYRGHPYGVDPNGGVKSLQAITAADLRTYARDQLITSRMLLVVVGDIAPEQVQRSVSRTLGTLPRGAYSWTLPPPAKSDKSELLLIDRSLATNYIVGYINGPPRSSKEYPAFHRAMNYLSSWISYEVREQNALSYAAYVEVLDRGAPGAVLFISTTRPDSAMRLVNRILLRYEREITIPRYMLRRAAEWFSTMYIYGTESASRHAEMLARAQLYEGDFHAAARQADIMKKLAFHDLRGAVKTYAKNIQYVYIGDTTRVKPEEFTKR